MPGPRQEVVAAWLAQFITRQLGTATEEEAGTGTVVSERMAHWRAVVKSMTCEQLAHVEKLRLEIDFNDQAESLVAIHDRQAKLLGPW